MKRRNGTFFSYIGRVDMNAETQSLEKLDVLVSALEDMIEIQDKIFEEKFYSNYREVSKLRNERYYPVRDNSKLSCPKS